MKRKIITFLLLILVLMAGCNNQNIDSNVTIKGHYEEPESINDKDTIILDGISKGEFIEVIVKGEIKNFKHIKLNWDNDKNILVEEETLNEIDSIKDKTIVINTYMPEGIPTEKLKWVNKNQEIKQFIIGEESKEKDKVWEFE